MGVKDYELSDRTIDEQDAELLGPNDKMNSNVGMYNQLLTKEELIAINQKEPIWARLRMAIHILFWVAWLALVLAAVLLVVFSEKCPPKPDLPFYKSKVGYWVDAFAFKDMNGDLVGDLNGLIEAKPYVMSSIGAGYLIIDSITRGSYKADSKYLGGATNYSAIDDALGTPKDLANLIAKSRRMGLELVIGLDFNSMSVTNSWMTNDNLGAKLTGAAPNSRTGDKAESSKAGFYSVFGPKPQMVDVDLKNARAVERVKDVVRHWLEVGFAGVMLKNVAFYVENGTPLDMPRWPTVPGSIPWFGKVQQDVMFQNESLSIVQQVRQVVDEMKSSTGHEKVLIVDAGDVGFGLTKDQDPAELFLGEGAAHMVVGRHFVRNRGWKAGPPAGLGEPSLKAYLDSTANSADNRANVFLPTATSSDAHHGSIRSLALSFLLPGPPLLYFGAELGLQAQERQIAAPVGVYPDGKVGPPPASSPLDSALSSHLPLPWDFQGRGFSHSNKTSDIFSKYIKEFKVQSTVSMALSVGRPPHVFDLVQALVKLRKHANLMWGSLNLVERYRDVANLEMFVRHAGEGYEPTVVAVLHDFQQPGITISLSEVCDKVKPVLVFPPQPRLPIDETISSHHIYLSGKVPAGDSPNGQNTLVYVFNCLKA